MQSALHTESPDPRIAIALMTPDDLDEVAALFDAYRHFYGQPPDSALAARFIRQRLACGDSWILVARNGAGRVAGFCQIYPSLSSVSACRTGILNDLYVADDQRRQGAGSALLAAAAAQAVALGLARLELSTAHDNLAARRLYERHGWVEEARFASYQLTTMPSDTAF